MCSRSKDIPNEELQGYASAPAGFVGRMRVTLRSVVNAVNMCAQRTRTILSNNAGADSYVVATLILFCDSLINVGASKIADALCATPLADWDELNTYEIETVARNATHLDIRGATTPNQMHHYVGRIKTLMGRDLRGHDVDEELADRATVTVPHSYNSHVINNCDCWHQDLYTILCGYTEEAIGAAPSAPQTMKRWWMSRAVWLSGGTSKGSPAAPALQTMLANDKRIRRTKKLICSHIGFKQIENALNSQPIMHARAATKNEPGLKRRPLRATDDTSYLIAAYASNNIEKYLSIRGSVMRQTPTDVQTTAIHVDLVAASKHLYTLCIDYSSFNNTHTTRTRMLGNLAMARAYNVYGQTEPARAAGWMARAQLNHWLGNVISNQGLSSGERDTARDNTMLHWAYATMVRTALKVNTPEWLERGRTHMCGDDEITTGMTWSEAVLYAHEHTVQGHALQPRKMMLSRHTGEFLQYNMFADNARLPRQPLAPALINFVSGSWYKTANYNQAEYPEQVADAASSCVRRGSNPHVMRRLCINTCNWLCSHSNWQTALSASNLFGAACSKPNNVNMATSTALQLNHNLQPQAVEDYVHSIDSMYALDDTMRIVVRRYAIDNVYSSLLADTRDNAQANTKALATANQKGQHGVANHHEKRIDTLLPEMADAGLKQRWLNSSTTQRDETQTWLALQLGLPLQLIAKIGMAYIVATASNQMRAHINIPSQTPTRPVPPLQQFLLPGAVMPMLC